MKDELSILSGLDQPLPTDSSEIDQRIDAIIGQAILQKNVYIALNACRSLIGVIKISGLSLARVLYAIKANWDKFGMDESFDDLVYEYLGRSPQTVDKYITIWKMFEDQVVPPRIAEQLKQRNIQDLVPIANAIAQGEEITEDQWERLAEAPDFNSVSRIVREDIKGADPRRSLLTISIDADGTLWAYKDGNRYFIGSLEVKDEEEIVQKAINRITNNSGILRKGG